jgi:hypothetical protein
MTGNYDSPTPNIPLLRKAVEWVEYQASLPMIDREWEQARYITKPDLRARMLIEVNHDREDFEQYYPQLAAIKNHCGTAYCVAAYIGQMYNEEYKYSDQIGDQHVSQYAMGLLGIDGDDAHALFMGDNTAADVRRIAERIAGEPL